MPIYEYFCEPCSKQYDVIKSIKVYDKKDPCPECGKVGYRILSANIQFLGSKVEDAEYNPAFGTIVKSKRHRDELAKQKNMVEIGNEKVENIHNKFDSDRAQKLAKSYEDI